MKLTKLSPTQKQKVVYGLFIAGCILVAGTFVMLKVSSQRAKAIKKDSGKTTEIQLGGENAKLLKQSKEEDLKTEITQKDRELKEKNDLISQLKGEMGAAPDSKEAQVNTKPEPTAKTGSNIKEKSSPPIPSQIAQDLSEPLPSPPPPQSASQNRTMVPLASPAVLQSAPGNPSEANKKKLPEKKIKGGLLTVTAKNDAKEDKNDSVKKKKTVYIPSGSFMQATLLTGIHAPTVKTGSISSAPCLIRVQTPAQLPNEVKENLAGCFVVGSAEGSLQDESAHIRTAFLSCIAKDKRAVIDQAIQGFVGDNTGSDGVRGRVVAKLDKTLGAAVIAGFFSGVGDVLKASSLTTNISPIGQTQTLNTDRLVQAGLGGSLSKASDKLVEFYMKLAELSMPVVEVGAGVPVTVVLEKGVELEIKDLCEGEICN